MNRLISKVISLGRSSRLPSCNYHKGCHYELNKEGDIIGVIGEEDELYDSLVDRFDLSIMDYTKTPEFFKIIHTYFNPMDIPFITHVNMSPMKVSDLASKLDLSLEVTEKKLADIVHKGLLIDFIRCGTQFVFLPEYIIGWYEWTMRYFSQGDDKIAKFERDTGMKFDELNDLYYNYLVMYYPEVDPKTFGSTIFRTTPYSFSPDEEEVLGHKVVTYDNVLSMIDLAEKIAIQNCICKFHETKKHNEELPEDIPLKCCITFNIAAEVVVGAGFGEYLTKEEANDLLKHLNETGHMHHAENCQHARFVCNCHKKWCGIGKVYEETGIYASNPSAVQPVFIEENCVGCNLCVDRCILSLIELVEIENEKGKKKRVAKLIDGAEDICGGCLNCYQSCGNGAIEYVKRDNPYRYPFDEYDWYVRMAVERGKLMTLLLDDPLSKTQSLLRAGLGWLLEHNPVAKKVLSNEDVQVYLSRLIGIVAKYLHEKEAGVR